MNTTLIPPTRPTRTGALPTMTQKQPPRAIPNFSAWGLALVELVIAYEWLISALNKVYSPTFRPGLAASIQASLQDNPNDWWVALVQRLVLPSAPMWATVVEVAELLVALGLFVGAILWISGRFPRTRVARLLNLVVLLALLTGIAMTVNYYLLAGHTFASLGRLHPDAPFDEGVSLDGVLTFLGVGLLLIHLIAHQGQARSGNAQRR